MAKKSRIIVGKGRPLPQKVLREASKRYTEDSVTIYDGATGLFATEEQKKKEQESIASI
jgi:hypothetical protein